MGVTRIPAAPELPPAIGESELRSTRFLPGVDTRVETGPVRFGDDWPGVFIRGDDTMGFRLTLQRVIAGTAGLFELKSLARLNELLRSCRVE